MAHTINWFNYSSKIYTTNRRQNALFSSLSRKVLVKDMRKNFYPIRSTDISDRVLFLKIKTIGNLRR